MDMLMISQVLWLRRALRHRKHWSEQELRQHQRRETARCARSRPPSRRSTGNSMTAWTAPVTDVAIWRSCGSAP